MGRRGRVRSVLREVVAVRVPWHTSVLLVLIVVCLLVVNVVLQMRVHRLSRDLENTQEMLGPAKGTSLKWLVGRGMDGQPVKLELGNGRSKALLLVLASRCPACEENWPYWRELVTHHQHSGVVLGDVEGDVDEVYLGRAGMPKGSKVLKLSPDLVQALKLIATPTTIVIGKDGIIEGVWVGKLDGKKVEEVLKTLRS